MGVSVAIRETGVDGTVRNRIDGHRQLGEMDETVQILGNPGAHFAAAEALWLSSSLLKEVKSHEFARDLTQALAVNGVTTIALKVAADTAPDNEKYAWPSGHASSSLRRPRSSTSTMVRWRAFRRSRWPGWWATSGWTHRFTTSRMWSLVAFWATSSARRSRENKAELPEVFGMKVVPFTDPETGASGLALWKQY